MAGKQPVKVGINGFGRIGAAGEGPMGDRLSSVSDCLDGCCRKARCQIHFG